MRPLSLLRPSACPALQVGRLAAAWRELAAVVPHRVRAAPLAVPGVPGRHGVLTGVRSCRGESVVAEPGQDMAGLPDDLPGLGEGGALAVDPALDLRVVGVVGGAGAGVRLAGLI